MHMDRSLICLSTSQSAAKLDTILEGKLRKNHKLLMPFLLVHFDANALPCWGCFAD
jgi:hypothetical protein